MIEINGERYRELRCAKCRKLIAYERTKGKICYLCPRCGEQNFFNFTDLKDWQKSNRIKGLKILRDKDEG